MLFNSIEFLIFFPIVVVLYFSSPQKYRWVFLLAASYYFYMCWRAEYIILIIISTLIDYFASIMMEKAKTVFDRRKFLLISLFSNLGLLFTFKYFNFFNHSIQSFLNNFNIFYDSPTFNLLLPVGISFYTFQTLSYTIDVYRGQRKAEHHLGYFALYVSFFPQLVAGPIERSTNLLPQFFKKYEFDAQRVSNGLKLMLWGFFKKVVIADRLAILVNQVYNNTGNYEGSALLLATYFFAFQIYCDFSGYSDIAIGAAQVMGFKLMDNFNRPYYAKNISEFWKRWHISLSTWFRDYLYIPLGGNKVGKRRWYSNLFLTFLISGLWHGANWTFVIWGAIHGFYLVFAIWTKKLSDKLYRFLKLYKGSFARKFVDVFITFHLVLFAWVFFRANSLNDAMYIIANTFPLNIVEFINNFLDPNIEMNLGLNKYEIIIALGNIIIMEIFHLIQRHNSMRQFLLTKPIIIRYAAYTLLLFLILFFGEFNLQEFIYFQF
jgi:D-alanyl-lipoteichoic acid acyltransferase DltB (MBOAT superfamily)